MPRSNKVELNVSDAPEVNPGGHTQFQAQCADAFVASRDHSGTSHGAMRATELKIENAVFEFKSAFPSLDIQLIREQYLLHFCNNAKTCQVLLQLADDGVPGPKQAVPLDDDFPTMVSNNTQPEEEMWEVLEDEEILIDDSILEEKRSWADRAKESADCWANSLISAPAPARNSARKARAHNMAASIMVCASAGHSLDTKKKKKTSPTRDADLEFNIRKSVGRRGRPIRADEE